MFVVAIDTQEVVEIHQRLVHRPQQYGYSCIAPGLRECNAPREGVQDRCVQGYSVNMSIADVLGLAQRARSLEDLVGYGYCVVDFRAEIGLRHIHGFA